MISMAGMLSAAWDSGVVGIRPVIADMAERPAFLSGAAAVGFQAAADIPEKAYII